MYPTQGQMPPANADEVLDTLGLYCPVPLWEAAKRIKRMRPGQVLMVLSDDEGIEEDIAVWCRRTGHELLGIVEEDGAYSVFIRKAGGR